MDVDRYLQELHDATVAQVEQAVRHPRATEPDAAAAVHATVQQLISAFTGAVTALAATGAIPATEQAFRTERLRTALAERELWRTETRTMSSAVGTTLHFTPVQGGSASTGRPDPRQSSPSRAPEDILAVLPVLRRVADTDALTVTVVAVEVWRQQLAVTWTARGTSLDRDPDAGTDPDEARAAFDRQREQREQLVGHACWHLHDDTGMTYAYAGGGASGSSGTFTGTLRFRPAPSPDARSLTITFSGAGDEPAAVTVDLLTGPAGQDRATGA